MYKLGIDLGGTKIEGIVLNESNEEKFRKRVPTEQEHGYERIINNVKKVYDMMLDEIDGDEHTFGIGTPGAISPRTGLLRNSNTQSLNDMPVRDDLERLLGRKIAMQNDANCFALAEAVCGAATDYDLVFGVIMGTGCGGGIVYKQQVFTGRHAIAGEWGHTSIDQQGPECWCGQRGCVERLISGGGLQELYEKQFGQKATAEEIVEAFQRGESREVEFMQEFFANFGRAMANLINVLDPDVVVLGGGLSNVEELYTEGVKETASRLFCDYFDTPIVSNKLGDSAGVFGAAFIGC